MVQEDTATSYMDNFLFLRYSCSITKGDLINFRTKKGKP